MEVLDWEQPSHTVVCEKCKSTLKYNKYDLKWEHADDSYFYIVCPVCEKMIWIPCSKINENE